MHRDPAELGGREFDLLVIGGGIFGTCAARSAAEQGLSVALVERGDFSGGTSANSFKLVHGGIRYLQHINIRRVVQSSADRRTFLKVAPHLVHPIPVVVPTYGHGKRGKGALRVAMALYDALTLDRNRGISDPERRIPRCRWISRKEILERYPGLSKNGLTGGGVFYDGQIFNPSRLVLAFARSAAEAGAVASNYVEARRLVIRGERVMGVEARDVLTDGRFEIRAKVVLNAAGPHAEGFLAHSLGQALVPETPWSRDAFFVVSGALIRGSGALALPATTRDPDAILSRGKRHLFLVPWHGATLIGVWHKVHQGEPDDFTVTRGEIQGFIEEINAVYRGLDLTPEDVALWNAGLIPFGENDPNVKDLRFGQRSRLIDHARERGLEGLITLIGARYTTAPSDATAVTDVVLRKLGSKQSSSRSDTTPIYGGNFDDFDALAKSAISEAPQGLPTAAVLALVQNQGTAYGRIFALARERPRLAATIGSSMVLRAEVVHAVRDEMAQTLEDVVLRRTDLGTAGFPGWTTLEECLALVASELRWDENRRLRELREVADHYPPKIRERRESEGRQRFFPSEHSAS